MKLYDTHMAPNPRRVRIFLAEKNIPVGSDDIEIESLSIMKGEHKKDDYRQISPLSQVPALQLDDGEVLTESIAICRYFEELHPNPILFGSTALDKAVIEMWNRRCELLLFMPVAMHFRHCHPAMAQLEKQNQQWGELNKKRALKIMDFINSQMKDRDWLSKNFSIADITALVALDFASATQCEIPDELGNLKAYHQRLSARPSAKAGM